MSQFHRRRSTVFHGLECLPRRTPWQPLEVRYHNSLSWAWVIPTVFHRLELYQQSFTGLSVRFVITTVFHRLECLPWHASRQPLEVRYTNSLSWAWVIPTVFHGLECLPRRAPRQPLEVRYTNSLSRAWVWGLLYQQSFTGLTVCLDLLYDNLWRSVTCQFGADSLREWWRWKAVDCNVCTKCSSLGVFACALKDLWDWHRCVTWRNLTSAEIRSV